jgi:hypothetical protein
MTSFAWRNWESTPAQGDFVVLVVKTSYSARQLIEWILQAKLCVCFGPAVKDLRDQGIRTLIDWSR